MRILFISNDLIAGNLAYLLKQEGHDVKLFIQEKARRRNFDYLVPKTDNWRRELSWVGKNGLIVFDDAGYGKVQDRLRKNGYTVFGGCEAGDKLELSREFGQEIFSRYGMKTVSLKDFENMDDAVEFVKKNPSSWVVKQNNHAPKTMNYVGVCEDGRDVVTVLRNYLQNESINHHRISLHRRVDGVEIGVGRYFNGNEWLGPIEFNVEYKKFFPGDIGPTTSEMGTLAWYDDNEQNRLYQETLAKVKPFLQEIKFKGDFEINCIVNKTGVYPLEATPRFGSPIIHLHSELHLSPWGEFLLAVARGDSYSLKWKRGYGIVVLLAAPPFPFAKYSRERLACGMDLYFDNLQKEDWAHIHFEEVSRRGDQFYISDNRGYILYVTGVGKTIEEARRTVYDRVNRIHFPKMIYRNDIGLKFAQEGHKKLKEWGYL